MRRAAAVAALALAACSHEGQSLSGVDRVAPPGPDVGREPPPGPDPHAAPPVADPHAGTTPVPDPSSPVAWSVPEGWKASPPTSKMRLAQFDLPGGAAQCVVFQGIGGEDDTNLERWVGQMGPGADAGAKTTKSERDGLKLTRLEVHGAYADAMAAGGAKTVSPATMLAAIVEHPGGKLHVKLVGASEVVEANAAKFDGFLASIKPK